MYHIVITSRFSAQDSVIQGAHKLWARPVILKLFSSLLFCLLLLSSKKQQHIFVQNLEPRLFPALYQQLGWFAHNQAIKKKNEKSHFQCITAYRSCVYIMTLPMCASTCHISLSVQTTSKLLKCSFVFRFVDQAVLFT